MKTKFQSQHFKTILIEYFKEKKRARPSDLEDDLLGGASSYNSYLWGTSNGPNSPFAKPLTELINDGLIAATRDENGWLYTWKGVNEKETIH